MHARVAAQPLETRCIDSRGERRHGIVAAPEAEAGAFGRGQDVVGRSCHLTPGRIRR